MMPVRRLRPEHDALRAAYGFGLFPVPAYRPARRAEWRVERHLPGAGDGYLGATAVEARTVLRRGRDVWMSTGSLERESHAWHVHCAHGLVVTAGVGLGMYAYAAAMKPDVDQVIAADISADIIALMREASRFDDWPCRRKVTLLEADALADDFPAWIARHSGGRAIDYLYADIWPAFPAGEAPGQTACMARALRPVAAGWWGQELSLAQHAGDGARSVDENGVRGYFAGVGVPAPAITPGYAAFCSDVARAYRVAPRDTVWRRLSAALLGRG